MNELDDEVMAQFDGLSDDMLARRLEAEMPQPQQEGAMPEAAPDDAGDEEALAAMLGADDGALAPAPVAHRPDLGADDPYKASDYEWDSKSKKNAQAMTGGGGMGGMAGMMGSMMK